MRHFSARGEPLFDAEGVFRGYRGVANDITKRKQRDGGAAPLPRGDGHLARRHPAGRARQHALHRREHHRLRHAGLQRGRSCWRSGRRTDVSRLSREALERGIRRPDRGRRRRPRRRLQVPLMRHGKDGSMLPVEMSRRAIRSADGLDHRRHRTRHPRAQLAAEQTIRRHAMQQSLIAAFGQQALANVDLDELLRRPPRWRRKGLGVDFSLVLQLAGNGRDAAAACRALAGTAALGGATAWPASTGNGWPVRGPAMAACCALDRAARSSTTSTPRRARLRLRRPCWCRQRHPQQRVRADPRRRAGRTACWRPARRRRGGFAPESIDFLQSLANTLATAIDRKGAEERLSYLAQFDTLTGLPNRHLLPRPPRADARAGAAQRLAASACCSSTSTASRPSTTRSATASATSCCAGGARGCRQCVRSGDTVGRLGGDEFAVVLSQPGAAPTTRRWSRRRSSTRWRAPFELDGHEVYVTASIGIAVYPGDGDDADTLLKNADTAMYRAKEQGRNGYQFYLPQMNERRDASACSCESRAARRARAQRVLLHYQPKVDLATGAHQRRRGAAALAASGARPRAAARSSSRSSRTPGSSCRSANGCCAAPASSSRAGRPRASTPRPVAVNLSARQFQQQQPRRDDRARSCARPASTPACSSSSSPSAADERRRGSGAHAARAEGARRAAVGRRFRHRLLEPRLPEALPARRAQDRPRVHPRRRSPTRTTPRSRSPSSASPTACGSRWWPKAWRPRRSSTSCARTAATRCRATTSPARWRSTTARRRSSKTAAQLKGPRLRLASRCRAALPSGRRRPAPCRARSSSAPSRTRAP